jgi:hypothetical protein
MVVAGPATYHEEEYATLYRYLGPRDWNGRIETIEEPKMEIVEEKTFIGPISGLTETGTMVNSVTPYEIGPGHDALHGSATVGKGAVG